MLTNLDKKKYIEEEIKKRNFYGKMEKKKKLMHYNDVEHHQNYLRELF